METNIKITDPLTKDLQERLRAIRNAKHQVMVIGAGDIERLSRALSASMSGVGFVMAQIANSMKMHPEELGRVGQMISFDEMPPRLPQNVIDHLKDLHNASKTIPYENLRILMEEPLIENPYNRHHVKSFGEHKLGVRKYKK